MILDRWDLDRDLQKERGSKTRLQILEDYRVLLNYL